MKTPEFSNLDKTFLKKFGLINGSIIGVLFGVILPLIFKLRFPLWPWIIACILIIFGLTKPLLLTNVYKIWMKFAALLGKINGSILLGIVFFILIWPIGIIFRFLLKKDPMNRKLDCQKGSYRIKSSAILKRNMEGPY